MKKIIIMVLIIATALSGITVPTRKAEALYAGTTLGELDNKITELLGTTDWEGACYARAPGSADEPIELIYLSDRYGNVIVDDRQIKIDCDAGSYDSYSGMRLLERFKSKYGDSDYNAYGIVEGFSMQLKCMKKEEYAHTPAFPDPAKTSWSSDDPGIASVDGNGMAYGIKPGETLIRATTLNDKNEPVEASFKIIVLKNQQKGARRPAIVNGKRDKIRADYVLSYDKKGKAVLKVTVKNYGKKKYKDSFYIRVWDLRDKETYPDELGRMYHSKRKCTLKPGKSKTFKIEIKKLSKLSKKRWYLDLENSADVSISL